MNLEGKGAVVTGGSRGIGEAIAEQLARAGARVLLTSRTQEAADAVAAALRDEGLAAWGLACDVSDEAAVAELVLAAAATIGTVSVLVNNAGIATSAPLHRTDRQTWDRVFGVNVLGTYLCTRAFTPAMVAAGWGRVINVASVAGLGGAPYISAYAASKHAVVGFTRCVAAELGPRGVTVNALCPGYVDTDMLTQAVDTVVAHSGVDRDKALALVLKTTGQPRAITVDEVAFAALSLCDARSAAINGQTVVLDAGGHLS